MVRVKGRFSTEKEVARRQKVSSSAKLKWELKRVDNDHDYGLNRDQESCCSRSIAGTFVVPDIGDLSGEVIVGNGEDWSAGRRIVELKVLAEALSSCKECGVPLQLSHASSIRSYGLAAIIKIQCSNTQCLHMNNVPTGKKHGEQSRTWDVNSKLVNALTHAGIGVTQLNSILAALNIPPVHYSLVSGRQSEMGKAVESVALDSIRDSIDEEKILCQHADEASLSVSVDAGWQKRGSGKSYNSLSGHATMIGSRTGKVLGYSVRSKTCRLRVNAEKAGTDPPPHDCRKNWHGSAKSMEQDMVVDMIRNCQTEGVKVSTIIGDDDTSTISKIHKEVDPTIKKVSDRNHIKKAFSNRLFMLQRSHSKFLSTNTIKYIKKCWNYMLSQNENNPQGISVGLKALSRHPFDDHSLCGDWCEHLNNPAKKFNNLPYGKCLKDKNLQQSLSQLFDSYQPHCEKLAVLGSTQANESLNNTIASKAPKRLHYSGSASLNYRVAAGVAQKNLGHGYVSKVNLRAGLSPGQYTLKLAKLRDLQHRKRKALAVTRTMKRRRMELKAKRLQSNLSKETREGPTYSSGMGLNTADSDELDQIPPPNPIPTNTPLTINKQTQKAIFFDLETTGLARSSHITQLAAVHEDNTFSCFILPKQPLSDEASRITGITVCDGKMFHRGEEVEGKAIHAALEEFLSFLRSFGKKIVLVGHNIFTFDCPVLFNALQSCNMIDQYREIIDGFFDSLKYFRSAYPGLKSYKQESLCQKHNIDYTEHDARGDAEALQTLFVKEHVELSIHTKFCTCNFESVDKKLLYSKVVSQNLPSLKPLIDIKVLTSSMARKVAGSGLKYPHLVLAFQRDPINGIHNLFLEQTSAGSHRVTKSSKVVSKVVEYFSTLREC